MCIQVLFSMIKLLKIHTLFINIDALRGYLVSVVSLGDSILVGFVSEASGLNSCVLSGYGRSLVTTCWIFHGNWTVIVSDLDGWGHWVSSLGFFTRI